MRLNKEAWSCLTPDEQSNLGMIHGMGKSSWQAGQMMNKSHYKLLEIKYRSERFLKMFTEHIELMGCIIPDYLVGDSMAKTYLRQCIEFRKKPMAAIEFMEKNLETRILKADLNKKVINAMRYWEKSDDAIAGTIYNFIKEFDRWNNFRILPKEVQEPSAFKRRQKNTYKRHIRLLQSIPQISIDKLISLYKAKKGQRYLYMPIIYKKEAQIIKVKAVKGSLETINNISYYLFKELSDAETYIEAVEEYVNKAEKDCKDGLDFWPIYRDIIKKAYNYNIIQGIVPSRRWLELACQKLEFF